jgi:hypothetical protein
VAIHDAAATHATATSVAISAAPTATSGSRLHATGGPPARSAAAPSGVTPVVRRPSSAASYGSHPCDAPASTSAARTRGVAPLGGRLHRWPAAWLGDVLARILDLPPARSASPVSPWPMTGTSRRHRIAAAATADEWCSSLVVDHRIERIGLGIDAPSGFRLCSLVALSSRQVEAFWMGCLSAHVWPMSP